MIIWWWFVSRFDARFMGPPGQGFRVRLEKIGPLRVSPQERHRKQSITHISPISSPNKISLKLS